MKPLVSVIITSKNSASTIRPLLKSVKAQSYKRIEIIFVDNNSTDNTKKIAKTFTTHVFNAGPERSAQRNFGANKSKGQYLLFLDTDMVLGKKVVEECVELIESNNRVGGVVIPEKSFGAGIWAEAKRFEREINEGESYFEAARFFPKELFGKFKGYDENITGPEDWDLPQRISKKFTIGRAKSYILHNEGELKIATLMRKKYYYGLSVYTYLQKNKKPILSQQTIYFLRPAFYKKWRTLLANPFKTLTMILMLGLELIAGGIGYIQGRLQNETA